VELEVGGKTGRPRLFDLGNLSSVSAFWLAALGGRLVDDGESSIASAASGTSSGDLGSPIWSSEAPMACRKGESSPNMGEV
jgi:hypothetical protein